MKNVILWMFLLTSLSLFSQTKSNHLYLSASKVAIDGYDLTTYFTLNKAIEGSKKFSTKHEGATYYFKSEQNKQQFLKNPEKFLPQYGGWCAYAMGEKAEKVSIDPETFIITDGKLYLFYNSYFNDTSEKWNVDPNGLRIKADRNWINTLKNN
ncbi:MAG: YHS domain-containing (seleno)protein [Flavobacteriales bacterium]|jgi:YHS domain-containing protein|tara:strand:+ start:4127 stop:4585 length:459 start_codon:yes stop_codon:yes gene_type:complete